MLPPVDIGGIPGPPEALPCCCHALSREVRALLPAAPASCAWRRCSSRSAAAGSFPAACLSTASRWAPSLAPSAEPGRLCDGEPRRGRWRAEPEPGRPFMTGRAGAVAAPAAAVVASADGSPRSGGIEAGPVGVAPVIGAAEGAFACSVELLLLPVPEAVLPELDSGAVGGLCRGEGRRPFSALLDDADDVPTGGRPPRGDCGRFPAPPSRGDDERSPDAGRGEESRPPPVRGDDERSPDPNRGEEARIGSLAGGVPFFF
jgi:hypothetical protein